MTADVPPAGTARDSETKRTLFLYVGRADNLVPTARLAARVLGTLDWGCAVKIVADV